MKLRSSILVLALIALSTQTWAQAFNRQIFLAAVKDRFKSEPTLMNLGSSNDPILFVRSAPPEWQTDLMIIPGMSLPSGSKASFGVSLAYLASQELKIPFASPGAGSLVWLHNDGRGRTISFVLNDGNFGNVVLRGVFDQTPCSIQQKDLATWTRISPQFANSICTDLKQALSDAKREYNNEQLLAAEKHNARNDIQLTQDWLAQAKGYKNASLVQQSIAVLESALTSQDLSDIKAKAQGLVTASRDLLEFINVRQAANQELSRTQPFLTQAPGYSKQSQVASAKKLLELALDGENTEDIKTKAQALTAVNVDLERYIQEQTAAAERKRQQDDEIRALVATKQRAEKVIDAANAGLSKARKYASDKEIATTIQTTTQAANELSAKARSTDPIDEAQISKSSDKLGTELEHLRKIVGETEILDSNTGKPVYESCILWAKRAGYIASDRPIQIYKDEETNRAADFAANPGRYMCRCMTIAIAGDQATTDQAKLEIARHFDPHTNNRVFATIIGWAAAKCVYDVGKH